MATSPEKKPFRFSLKQLFCLMLFIVGMLLSIGYNSPEDRSKKVTGFVVLLLSVCLAGAAESRITFDLLVKTTKAKLRDLFSISGAVQVGGSLLFLAAIVKSTDFTWFKALLLVTFAWYSVPYLLLREERRKPRLD